MNKDKLLPLLILKYKGQCQYCYSQVMMPRDAYKLNLKMYKHFIYQNDRKIRIASIEHIKRKDKGGLNILKHTTLACSYCNLKRDVIYQIQKKISKYQLTKKELFTANILTEFY